MNYSDIKYTDMLNGKGIRVSLFVSGCSHRCKGCFNKVTWDPEYGKPFTEKEENEIFEYFKKYGKTLAGLSLLGGDPTYHKNLEPLIKFVKKFRELFPGKDVWMWTGFTWDQIVRDEKKLELVSLCDVIIDGKFSIEEKNLNLKWKGSCNQRVIDVKKSLETGEVVEKI